MLNKSGSTFQISQDGTNVLTLTDTGGASTMYVEPWPLTQSYILIHSTASSANLPPNGVRLDPVAYGPYLGVIEMPGATPTNITQAVLALNLSAYFYFKDIEITYQASAPSTETDPAPNFQLIWTTPQTDHIIWDQCYFHGPPAQDRIVNAGTWGGTNQAIVNSVFDNIDYWHAAFQVSASTVGTNSFTIAPGTISWPNASNTKSACTWASNVPITIGGSSGSFYLTVNPSGCGWTVTATTGMTATGTGVTLVSTGSPNWPKDGSGVFTQLNYGYGSWNGSAVTYSDLVPSQSGGNPAMVDAWGQAESSTGLQMSDGPGPFMFLNNSYSGEGIIGLFKDEYEQFACPTFCQYVYNTIDLSAVRNTVQWDPKYFNTAYPSINPTPNWNGSWWYGRNAFELKQGGRAKFDGNIVQAYGGLANGEGISLYSYAGCGGSCLSGFLSNPNTEAMADVSITNNTILGGGAAFTLTGNNTIGVIVPPPLKRVKIANNIVISNNGWLATGSPSANLAQGRTIRTANTESVIIDHNTAYEGAGGGNAAVSIVLCLSDGFQITNNLFNYDLAASSQGIEYETGGSGGNCSNVPAQNTQGTSLLSYLPQSNFSNNGFVGTWSTDTPGSTVDMTSGQITAAQALYPASNYFVTGSTLSTRTTSTGWYSPDAYGRYVGNYLLIPQTTYPWCSGCTHRGADGRQTGADINALWAAQGQVQNVHVSAIGTTTASVTWQAPPELTGNYAVADVASGICTIDYGTANFPSGSGSWTRIAAGSINVVNAGFGTTIQTASLTGLTTGTAYYARVNCGAQQPVLTFSTR